MVEGKLHRAFAGFVLGQFFCKGVMRGGRRVEADVIFKRGEMRQHAILLESGHGIADGLLRVGRSGFDRRADLLQDRLNVFREGGDVFVDGGGGGGCHGGFILFHFVQLKI